jgi:large subunit ribosomal protein L30
MLRIRLVKSPISNVPRNRATIAALGLRRLGQVVEKPDLPAIRGMIHQVKHLVTWEVLEGEPRTGRRGLAAVGAAKTAPAPEPKPKSPRGKATEESGT